MAVDPWFLDCYNRVVVICPVPEEWGHDFVLGYVHVVLEYCDLRVCTHSELVEEFSDVVFSFSMVLTVSESAEVELF